MTLAELVRRWSLWAPDRCAVIDRGTHVTYRELHERATRLAHALLSAGCRKGDRLLTLLDNGTPALETMLAAARIGMIVTPVNTRTAEAELPQLVELVAPAFVVTRSADALSRLVSDVPMIATEDGGYDELLHGQPVGEPTVDVRAEDLAAIVFTGGTTGLPKGCAFRHSGLMEHAHHLIRAYDLDATSRFLQLYPHTSAGAFNVTLTPCLAVGATIVLDDATRFTGERFIENVERYRITHTQMVPTMIVRLLHALEGRSADLSSLQMVGYGSAPIARDTVDEMLARMGPIFMQVYGATEAGGLTHTLDREVHKDPGRRQLASCGRALPGVEVRLLDEAGASVPVGEVGEVAFRSNYLSVGVWQGDGRVETLVQDGWLRSGDLGYLDEMEYLYLVDRAKDVVITGGFNVASVEVEDVLHRHPAVLGAAVIGLPDAEWGEVVHAVVELRPDARVRPEELIDHCRAHLAGYKCPRSIEIRDVLPKSPVGKIIKPQLRRELFERLAPTIPFLTESP